MQLQSNEIDDDTRRNLEQALRLMEQKAQLQREQATEAARSAGDNEAAAKAAEREADAFERAADAAERTRQSRTSAVGNSKIQIELTTKASENGAPNFRQSDLANLANQLTPVILQAIRSELGRGL